jgi:hypothetical protein
LTALSKIPVDKQTPEQQASIERLTTSIEANRGIITHLLQQANIMPELDPKAMADSVSQQMITGQNPYPMQSYYNGGPTQMEPLRPGGMGLPAVPNPITGPVRNTTPPAPTPAVKQAPAVKARGGKSDVSKFGITKVQIVPHS